MLKTTRLFYVSNSDSTSAFLFIVVSICVRPTPKLSAILLELSPRSEDFITCTRSSRDNALRFWEAMAKTDRICQFLPTADDVFKIAQAILIKTFYPASYLIEENNQLPNLYTIAHWTVYTIVLFAPIVIKAQFRLQ